MLNSPGPASELHQEYGRYGPYVVTKRGTLLGAIELQGRDPDGLSFLDFQALTLIGRDIYQTVPDDFNISQYLGHYGDETVSLRPREHPVCNLLSMRRARFLNQRRLTGSRIVHFFEIRPEEDLTELQRLGFLKNLSLYPFNRRARRLVNTRLSSRDAVVTTLRELQRQKRELDATLKEVAEKWSTVIHARVLPLQEIWAHLRFLTTLDPDMLHLGAMESVPLEHWDVYLPDGDRQAVDLDGMTCLKLYGDRHRYARIASILRFGEGMTFPGMWASSHASPARLPHDFILCMRFKGLTKLQRSLLFQSKENELQRQSFSFTSIIKGYEQLSEKDQRAIMKQSIARKVEELEEAELVDDRWGMGSAHVLCFSTDPERLRAACTDMKKSLTQSGFSMLWETAGLMPAYRAFLPGGSGERLRDMPYTTTQLGATSLLYKPSDGQRVVADLGNEEAQYVFLSADGSPFYFSPFTNGKCVVILVGPIRSGKSFVRATLATHWLKYGGLYRALDIDPGAEPVAQCFGKDGGIFRIDGHKDRGFNPFAIGNADDTLFYAHIKDLVIQMLATNDVAELQTLALHEQRALDQAITATLQLPPRLRHFASFADHCPKELRRKLERFIPGGMYGHLFGQPVDAIGAVDKKAAAFNLIGLKEDPIGLPLAMSEITFRVTRTFEDPALRTVPKYLDIDEAHVHLKNPDHTQYIVSKVRTWGKWLGGIGLSTQSPKEFYDLPDWGALRSASSTFFFMADPQMDEGLYQSAFGLTKGECEAIRQLVPRREAYIVQPDLGVSKRISLEVEPEQYVVSTSKPKDVAIRERNTERLPFEEAVDATVRDLGLADTDEHENPQETAHV